MHLANTSVSFIKDNHGDEWQMSSDFNQNHNMSTNFTKLQSIQFKKKIHPAGLSRSMQTDGWKGGRQTNIQDEANSRFT